LISRKGTFEEHEFPKSTFAGIEELFGIQLVYSFVIGIISRNFEYFLNHQSSKIGYKNISPNTRGVTLFRFIFYIFTNGVAAGFLLIII
jgi:hypothetical protein